MPVPVRESHLAAARPPSLPQVLAAGFLPRGDGGGGPGFGAGGAADRMEPGSLLARLAEDARPLGTEPPGAEPPDGGLAVPSRLSDDELIGVLRAWRRLASWATAGELAAISELTERRWAQIASGAHRDLLEHLGDEVAAALTLTARSADRVLELACGLARLPRTRAALAKGDIDQAKAAVITDETSALDDTLAAAVEDVVIGDAPGQTTGQLRAAIRRAVLSADPEAAGRRREKARRDARVETWDERSGTAALAGRDLPPAEVLAADNRINALACGLKADGASGSLDQLRARVYTALLLGQSIETLRPVPAPAPAPAPAPDPGPVPDPGPAPDTTEEMAGPGSMGRGAAGGAYDGLGGSVNLTMPLSSWLGAQGPGEVAGFGPADAATCRNLAAALAARRGSRWCLTLTDQAGRAVGHGCARQGPRNSGTGWELTVTISALGPGRCSHDGESPGYRPSRKLRHLVEVRQGTCSFPGCRRAARRCDLDHTTPHDQGGRTCACNLAPLCRRHHRAKQTEGWRLQQPEPGVLIWTLPHGRSYRAEPDRYLTDEACPA